MDNNNGSNMKNGNHTKRNAAGMLLIGTALGAGMMAAKKNAEKTPMQKMKHRFKH